MRRLWHFIKNVMGVIFRHPVTGTSIIATLADGRIVMVKRRDNGQWGLPGGMVDWGEDLPTAVHRELAEETGLEVAKIKRLVGVYSHPDRDPRVHSICVVVEVEAVGQMQALDEMEVMDVQAFYRDEIPPGKLSHDHSRQLQDYFNGLTTLA
ncbi:NUDIX hydrolase [Alkalinema sp. FACHB-956]|uniref:NUDIX domain-containing protein n=1 Tax=Alkalinema sp. FACHB-956 TaxID=2692768 RepID=UPI001685B8DD|nr:NUDIX hydrolase [Alkalinema sp. FACHB-956]MBD2329733.1 NUDIX hydrolase [Alkalinema sp. FACHB-956]